MERDVVCGMQVDPANASAVSHFGGKKYYFCSKGCKAKFDAQHAAQSTSVKPAAVEQLVLAFHCAHAGNRVPSSSSWQR